MTDELRFMIGFSSIGLRKFKIVYRKIFLSFLCFLLHHAGFSQPQLLLVGPAKDFTLDNLQNIYLVTPTDEVVKFSPAGLAQFRYANTTLGQPALLDATNPFHLLLFYPDYQNVVMLDRTLNLTAQVNLFRFGFSKVNAVSMASDGLLWVYDEANFRLKKITSDGAVAVESNDLSLTFDRPVRPVFLVEREQTVFLNDPEIGILVFDIFGKYLKTIDLKGLTDFQVLEDRLVYRREDRWCTFHLRTLLESPVQLPEGIPADGKLLIGTDDGFLLNPAGVLVFKL